MDFPKETIVSSCNPVYDLFLLHTSSYPVSDAPHVTEKVIKIEEGQEASQQGFISVDVFLSEVRDILKLEERQREKRKISV